MDVLGGAEVEWKQGPWSWGMLRTKLGIGCGTDLGWQELGSKDSKPGVRSSLREGQTRGDQGISLKSRM